MICYVLCFCMSQGRALLNAIGNLELSGAYADALRKLGHELEDVAGQVRCFYDKFCSIIMADRFFFLGYKGDVRITPLCLVS